MVWRHAIVSRPYPPPPPPRCGLSRRFGVACARGVFVALLAAPAAQAQVATFTLSLTNPPLVEGGVAQFTIHRSGGVSTPRLITWRLEHDTTDDADFSSNLNGVEIFNQGERSMSFTISTTDDDEAEGRDGETFRVLLACISCEGDRVFNGDPFTLVDNDTIYFTLSGPDTVCEGDETVNVGYTLTHGGASITQTTALQWVIDNTPSVRWRPDEPRPEIAQLTDFRGARSGSVTFEPGDDGASRDIRLSLVGDNRQEGAEGFALAVIRDLRTIISHPVLIVDDEWNFEITGPGYILESDADVTETYTVTFRGPSEILSAANLLWEVRHTDTGAGDFRLPGARSLDFGNAPLDASRTFDVVVRGDSVNEGDEYFELRVDPLAFNFTVSQDGTDFDLRVDTSAPNFILAACPLRVAIVDDDDTTFRVIRGARVYNEGRPSGRNYHFATSGPLPSVESVQFSVRIAHGTTSPDDFEDTLSIIGGVGTPRVAFDGFVQTVNLNIRHDDLVEGHEHFWVEVGPLNFVVPDDRYRVLIYDDDVSTFVLNGPGTVQEADADVTATYTVDRIGAELTAAADVTWRLRHAAVDGTAAADFSGATGGTLTFAAGEDSKTFPVIVAADSLVEGNERFLLSLDAPGHYVGIGSYAGIDTNTRSITIDDADDLKTFTYSLSAGRVGEGGTIQMVICYDAATAGVGLDVATDLNARFTNDCPPGVPSCRRADGADWGSGLSLSAAETANGGGAIFTPVYRIPAGQQDGTCAQLLVQPPDDSLNELEEHYRVTLSGGDANTLIRPASVQGIINASDPIGVSVPTTHTFTEGDTANVPFRITFSIPAGVTWAGGSNIRIAYTLNGDARQTAAIPWAGVAASGHYDFTLGGAADTTPEPHTVSRFVLTGINAAGFHADLSGNTAITVTELDDDPMFWRVLGQPFDPRGQEPFAFASAPEDAPPIASPTSAVLFPGVPSATNPRPDSYLSFAGADANHPNALSNPSVPATTTLTYCLFSSSRSPATGGAADEPGRDFTWPPGYDPTATDADDECVGRGTVTVPPGATHNPYRLAIVLNDDNLNEAAESINAVITTAVAAQGRRVVLRTDESIGYDIRSQVIGGQIILDNDTIRVSIAATGRDFDPDTPGVQVGEGRDAVFLVTLSNPAVHRGASFRFPWAVGVPYAIGGMVEAADYAVTPTSPLRLLPGQTTATITVTLVEDADTESEDLTVSLIRGGPSFLTRLVATGSIDLDTGRDSATIGVINRTADRTLLLTRHTDAARTLVATTDSVAEGGAADGALFYSIGLADGSLAFPEDTVVTWAVSHGDPPTSAADFTAFAPTGSVTFPANDTGAMRHFSVRIADDSANEANERFHVGLSVADPEAHGGTDGTTATVTIVDNDPIRVRIAATGRDFDPDTPGVQVGEGRDVVFLVTLDRSVLSEVRAPYVIGGTVEAADYTVNPASPLVFAPGAVTGAITFSLVEDATDTQSEDLTVTLAASGYTAPGAIARSPVADEQSATFKVVNKTYDRTLTLTRHTDAGRTTAVSGAGRIAEGAGGGDVRLYYRVGLRTGDLALPTATAVAWAVHHGDPATAAADFSSVSGSVLFPAGDAAATRDFTVVVADDNLNEDTERFSVRLSVANAVALDMNTAAADTLTVDDNDPLSLSVAPTGVRSVDEGDSVVHTLHLGAVPTREITFRYDFGATDARYTTATTTDYTDANNGSLTIAANTSPPTAEIPVAIVDDNLNEPAEFFGWRHRSTTGHYGVIGGSPGADILIRPSDPITLRVTVVAGAVRQGGTAAFEVAIDSVPVRNVEVEWSVNELGAPALITTRTGTLVFAPGTNQLTRTVSVPIGSDPSSSVNDPDEFLTLRIVSVTGHHGTLTGGDATAQVTVRPGAEVPVRIRVFLEGAVVP